LKQSQLLKGVLEGCVLAIVAKGEIYGYELIQALQQAGFNSVMGGTIYPLLAKLEKNGDLPVACVLRLRAQTENTIMSLSKVEQALLPLSDNGSSWLCRWLQFYIKGMTLMSEHSSQWYRDQTNQLIQSLPRLHN